MQRTIFTCDICDAQVSFAREPLRSPGFVAHFRRDWAVYPRQNSEKKALICTNCEKVLHRARELAVMIPEPSDVIYVGGNLIPLYGEHPTPYIDPE